MFPSIQFLFFQNKLQIEHIDEAIARWMQENLEFVVFDREVERDITGWNEPNFMHELCSCGMFKRRKHALVPVGVVPGIISPSGIIEDMIIYQHHSGNEDDPWTLCFAWVSNQLTRGERNPPESSEAAWLALCCMPAQLDLTDD